MGDFWHNLAGSVRTSLGEHAMRRERYAEGSFDDNFPPTFVLVFCIALAWACDAGSWLWEKLPPRRRINPHATGMRNRGLSSRLLNPDT